MTDDKLQDVTATVYNTLRAANKARDKLWDSSHKFGDMFHALELAGEVGELCNVIKKFERESLGYPGSRATEADLCDELADVQICLDKLAMKYNIDMNAIVADKFNRTSEKNGFPVFLSFDYDKPALMHTANRIVDRLAEKAVLLGPKLSELTEADCYLPVRDTQAAYLSICDKIGNGRYAEATQRTIDGAVAEQDRVRNLFACDLKEAYGLVNHPKADKVFEMAWERTHASGEGDVLRCYDELVELLQPVEPDPAPAFATSGVEAINAERLRQIEVEGFGRTHDSASSVTSFGNAAAAYIMNSISYWPGHWNKDMFKPGRFGVAGDRRRRLVKAGALIAAAIDRLDAGE